MFRISRPAAAGVAGVVTAAFLSLPAMATPINISQQVPGVGDNVFANNGNKIVNITSPNDADGNPIGNVYAGAFALSANAIGVDFTAWCLDIYDNLSLASDYQITTTPFSDLTLSVDDQADIQALFNTSFSGLDLSNDTQSAGFQVALWEIAFEGGVRDDYDAAGGDFAIVSGDVSGAANDFLALLGGTNTGNYELTFLQSSDGTSQDLVTVSTVPLPASGLMLMGALAGLGLLSASRRRAGSAA